MKNLYQYKKELENVSDKVIKATLENTLAQIEILESIYMTGGKLNIFSKTFTDAAYNERQALCQLSSACYSIQRDREPKTPTT